MRILVVEDDAPVADFISSSLVLESYDVTVAGTGRQGQEAAESGSCDLMLLDLNLPDMSGIEVLRRVKKSNPRLPVLILTGHTRLEDRVEGLNAGADDYVS